VGHCQRPGGISDFVTYKFKQGVSTRTACQAFCDASLACIGYAYRANYRGGYCIVIGPGLDTDLAGGWSPGCRIRENCLTTTIGGADGNSAVVCAAVAGRN
jgi:hypothetical protein